MDNEENFHEEIMARMFGDEGFINDLWNRYRLSEKIETLKLSGWSEEMMILEYLKTHDSRKETVEEMMDDDS